MIFSDLTKSSGEWGFMAPKDYTNYLIFINVYMIGLIAIFFFFFTTDYKRTQVHKIH
jgi:hypothetical protein